MKQSCYRVMQYLSTNVGIYDLRTRISEIRKAGFPIVGEYEKGKNRFGEDVRFMRYRIGG